MFSKVTRLETLLEAVRDALVGMDQKGVIRFVNRQTEVLFGYDRDDLIGEHIEKLLPEALWQIYATHLENYFADPRTRSSGLDLELRGRQQNGMEFPVNVSLSHIDTGDVLLVITGAGDVAKQKDAVRNAELITAIVEYSQDAIIGTTREGAITSWNPAAVRIYGYSSREIIGRSIKLLVPEDRAGEFSATLDRAKRGEHIGPRETVRVRKDGVPVPVSVTVAPLRDEEGRVVGTSAVHRDVTEHRRAFEVAQRMEAIVQSSDDAIIGRTLEGIVTTWNPAAETMYGYTSQEIIGQPVDTLIPEDRRAEAAAVTARITAGERVAHLETIRVRRDGTRFPASLTISPIHDSEGAIVGVSSVHRDVTEQRKAFEVAQYMKAIVEGSDDAVISRTIEGIITSWNPAAERLYGYSGQEIIGQSIDNLVPEDVLAETRTVLAKIKAARPVERLETIRVRKDGTLIPVSLTVSPIRDPDGDIIGASGIHRDVTEQRRAFEVAQRMAAIVESSDDAIIGRTLEGTVTSWNPAAERLYGYCSEEIIGTSFDRLVPQDRLAEISEMVARIKAGRHVERLETIRVRKDGTLVPVSVTLSPIRGEDGAIVGVSAIHRDAIHRDVSEQRQAFEVAQRMEAADTGPHSAYLMLPDTRYLDKSSMDAPKTLSIAALCVLAAATVAGPFVPLTGDAWRVYYGVVAIGAILIAFLSVVRTCPRRRGAWLLLVAGFGIWVAGDLLASVEHSLWRLETHPVPSDAVYLGAYGLLAAGCLVMVRRRGAGRDLTALLDATIIATGTAVVAAVFLIVPLAAHSELTGFGKVISSAYPLGDVLLIAMIVRMWAAPGARSLSYRLLVSALGMTLAADVIWNVSVAVHGTTVADRRTDTLYLASFVLLGLAACVPSMTTLTEQIPDRVGQASAQRRLVVLAIGAMLPSVTLLIAGARGDAVPWQAIGLGALLILGLVLVRMSGILRTVEVQAVQLAALARADGLTGAPNRRTWDHELSKACAASLEHNTTLCVAMMDIDHFKVYNDTHGHQAGDRLLREAVAAWTERLGAGALLARYCGEQFSVLLPGLTRAQAQAQIRSLSAVTPNGQTFSAGVSTWDPSTEPAIAVAWADQALYEAKRTGRDRVLTYDGNSAPAPGQPSAPAVEVAVPPFAAGSLGEDKKPKHPDEQPSPG